MKPESTLSSISRPPIQDMEAELADDAICPFHKGIIGQSDGVNGKVYWCPIGRQYFRYVKGGAEIGFRTRISYPKAGVV